MSENAKLDTFDRLVRDLWEQEGYDVVTGDEVDLVAHREEETELLETYPEGRATTADVDDAVSRLIESAEANHVTLVVADEVPPVLREQTEGWDVSLVGETGLRGMADSRDVSAVLGGDSSGSDPVASEDPPAPPADAVEGADDARVASTVQRRERWLLGREFGALLLEMLLVVLLVVTLGYLLVQVAALV